MTDDPVYANDYLPGRLVKLATDSELPYMGTGLIVNTRYVRGGHTSFGGYSVYLDIWWSNGEYYKGVAMDDLTLVATCQERPAID